MTVNDDGERFQKAYLRSYADLVHFAMRRHQSPEHAEDLVAEACTIAWQRVHELPRDEGEARAWLFGITRRLLLAQHRSDRRGQALSVRIAEQTSLRVGSHDDRVALSIDRSLGRQVPGGPQRSDGAGVRR